MDDVDLVVTETFSNAVRHADNQGLPVSVGVTIQRGRLRLEVRDHDPRGVTLVRASVYDDGGRGLLLVDALCDRWGVLPRPDGKVVFTEFTPSRPGDALR